MGDLSESDETTCSERCAVIEGGFNDLPGEKRAFLGVSLALVFSGD